MRNTDPSLPQARDTFFAQAGRTSPAELAEQMQHSLDDPCVKVVLEAVTGFVLILNENRQILAANQELLDALNRTEESVVGLRPGEAFNCIHFTSGTDGCGTAQRCGDCGAVLAILAAQTTFQTADNECRLSLHRHGKQETMDLRVRAAPLEVNGYRLMAFVLHDVSRQKRRDILEETFFHDLLNEIGGLAGWSELLQRADPNTAARKIVSLAESLREEVVTQKALVAAERGELVVVQEPFDASELWQKLEVIFGRHSSASGKIFDLLPLPDRTALVSDKTLVLRVLVNMLKNAFEATETGGVVQLWMQWRGDSPTFVVGDAAVIPLEVQQRMFERPFSPDSGPGSGIGTYSMKLYGEHYLRGSVSFTSDETRGTRFYFSLPPQLPGENRAPARQALAVLRHSRGSGASVLLVEEDEALLKLGSFLLTRLGYAAVAYANEAEALDAFRAAPETFDAVIADWAMSGMDGEDFCSRLLEVRADIPVLMCIGMRQPDTPAPAVPAVRGWLRKPFTFQTLAEALKQAIPASHAARPPAAKSPAGAIPPLYTGKRIQLIEDDTVTGELVHGLLKAEGFDVTCAKGGIEGLNDVELNKPDLLILDLMLPDVSGLEICRRLRGSEEFKRLPIVILTARGSDVDRVLGLEAGADDYLVKPFKGVELAARIRALLRRSSDSQDAKAIIQAGDLVLDPDSVRATYGGDELPLTAVEFHLLHFLASHPKRVFSRDQLLNAVWGPNHFVGPRIVDVYVRQLRQKLKAKRGGLGLIRTLRGIGYSFEVPINVVPYCREQFRI